MSTFARSCFLEIKLAYNYIISLQKYVNNYETNTL